jgi:mitogen-activated protein kinase 15
LLGSTKYTTGVGKSKTKKDMWSIGCILGELLGGKPMFPGASTMNQLERIISVTGMPSNKDIDAINSAFASSMLENIQEVDIKKLKEIYPKAKKECLDFMSKLLQFNPEKRMTSEVNKK